MRTALVFAFFGNRQTVRIRFYLKGETRSLAAWGTPGRSFHPSQKQQTRREIYEKASLSCIGGKWTGFCSSAEFRRSSLRRNSRGCGSRGRRIPGWLLLWLPVVLLLWELSLWVLPTIFLILFGPVILLVQRAASLLSPPSPSLLPKLLG